MAWDVANTRDCAERRKDEDTHIRRMLPRTRLLHVKAAGALAGLGQELIPYNKIFQAYYDAGCRGPVSAETHNPDKPVSDQEQSRRLVDVIRNAWPPAAPTKRAVIQKFCHDQPLPATS